MVTKQRTIVVALLVLLCLGSAASVSAQEGKPFITTWQGKKGVELKIPIVGHDYRLIVKDDKGQEVSKQEHLTIANVETAPSFTPTEDGLYTVEVGPEGVQYMQMMAANGAKGSAEALTSVKQFGDVKWTTTVRMFYNCKNMVFADEIDSPKLDWVENMGEMFYGCTTFNQPLTNWKVDNVTDMNSMFSGCHSFNQPFEQWNTGKVTDMHEMFANCHVFNQPLNWDVSNVTNMAGMFYYCPDFDQPLGSWNVAKVTNMRTMFEGCRNFNQSLENWKVDNVTDMVRMFDGCLRFNQPLKWNVGKVTRIDYMFRNCLAFNQPLEDWDVSQVTNMNNLFDGCLVFNQPLAKWKVGNVTSMQWMFNNCRAFNQSLEGWDVSQVTDMSYMFMSCHAFNQPLGKWDVSKVTNMSAMFAVCRAFNQPLEWNVEKVTNMMYMFLGCHAFNQPLVWNVGNVTNMLAMFADCRAFNQPLEGWDVSKVTNMKAMFNNCLSFNQSLGSWKIKTPIGGIRQTGLSVQNYSKSLAGWASQADVASNIAWGKNVEGLVYNDEGNTARETLKTKGWTFDGDSYLSSGISITPRSLSLRVGEKYELSVEKWGIGDDEVVSLSVDKEGVLAYELAADGKHIVVEVLKADGECKITATIAKKEGVHEECVASCTVVGYVAVNEISLSHKRKVLKVGDKFTMTASVLPAEATTKQVKWSSTDGNIAPIDKNTGEITAKKEGTCTIIAQSLEGWSVVSATCELVVEENIKPVTAITVTAEKNTIKVGKTTTVLATLTPADATVKWVTWSSSDPSVATVDENGVVMGLKNGTCSIIATSEENGSNVKGECTLTVEIEPVTTITVEPATKTLKVGETLTLTATVAPENATVKSVTWSSSDATVASVETATGLVTALKKGTCAIIATSEDGSNVKGECALTVAIEPVTTITVEPATKTLKIGETLTLTATVAPENATVKSVTWSSSDATVASVETATGLVTALKNGNCSIIATSEDGSNVKGECALTVEIEPVTTITVEPATKTLKIGETLTLTATVAPENATVKSVTWSSSDATVASVETATGLVTALKNGNCSIIATSEDGSNVKGECALTVEIEPVTTITVEPATKTLKIGETLTLTATVAPENATVKSVTWSSSDATVASVEPATGKVTALKKGTCSIIATSEDGSNVKGECALTVEIEPVTTITVEPATKTLKIGETLTLTATVAPENATVKSVTWSSSDATVASVEPATGKVTALKKGTCSIIATSEDGSNVKGECALTVEGNGNAVEDAALASLSVAPNPFVSQLRIANPAGVSAHYELLNVSGNVVRSGVLEGNELLLDTEALPTGVYIMRFSAANSSQKTIRVVKH